ncbi:hypothetical protein QAD02_002496 [Eretmocerus hayati]|uniref:Uncharacterized protein n=1 Tax=Eretmocerus hayati TaxID=131215 RepID=A0ACC2NJK2_9HYME|nr:hypothetical protein QAD02_002496 [Eretmocerus hayati]
MSFLYVSIQSSNHAWTNYSITITMGNILRKFVSKEVLFKYTAIKGSATSSKETENSVDKNSFEPLQFCKYIFGFIRVHRGKKFKTTCLDGELKTGLSSVFGNAKKWKST